MTEPCHDDHASMSLLMAFRNVREAMQAMKARQMIVSFNGYGDTGVVENIALIDADGKSLGAIEARADYPKHEKSINDGVIVALSTLYPGWEINFGSQGNMTFSLNDHGEMDVRCDGTHNDETACDIPNEVKEKMLKIIQKHIDSSMGALNNIPESVSKIEIHANMRKGNVVDISVSASDGNNEGLDDEQINKIADLLRGTILAASEPLKSLHETENCGDIYFVDMDFSIRRNDVGWRVSGDDFHIFECVPMRVPMDTAMLSVSDEERFALDEAGFTFHGEKFGGEENRFERSRPSP